LSRPTGASHFSLLVQRKVTKRKHTPSSRLPRYALQVRMPSGNFSKGRPCPFEKRRASMRAAPAGFAPNGLPLRYGAPEKLKAKAKAKQQAQATSNKRQAASGKRQAASGKRS
ncbi:hypothetical protein, partial [Xanthomonas campestris]|uniref:hypothetical protein n=1 Tax=Xanthomonas campestris TaxID=339 RepID=UPI002B235E47